MWRISYVVCGCFVVAQDFPEYRQAVAEKVRIWPKGYEDVEVFEWR